MARRTSEDARARRPGLMLRTIRRWFAREERAHPRSAAPPPDADKLLQPVSAALQAGDEDAAIRLLEAITWTHPQLADAHRMLGELMQKRGQIDDARDSYTLALHHAPDSARAHYALATLELSQRRV